MLEFIFSSFWVYCGITAWLYAICATIAYVAECFRNRK
jgi:hypothetical protein